MGKGALLLAVCGLCLAGLSLGEEEQIQPANAMKPFFWPHMSAWWMWPWMWAWMFNPFTAMWGHAGLQAYSFYQMPAGFMPPPPPPAPYPFPSYLPGTYWNPSSRYPSFLETDESEDAGAGASSFVQTSSKQMIPGFGSLPLAMNLRYGAPYYRFDPYMPLVTPYYGFYLWDNPQKNPSLTPYYNPFVNPPPPVPPRVPPYPSFAPHYHHQHVIPPYYPYPTAPFLQPAPFAPYIMPTYLAPGATTPSGPEAGFSAGMSNQ